MPHALTWLPGTLRRAGLKVAEVDGWADRGRAEMGPVFGVMCHHTATPASAPGNMPTLNVIRAGHGTLPGPLYNLALGRDGTFYVVAAGRANHAGEGSFAGVGGNGRFIGIGAENSGAASDPWPEVQMDAYVRGVAALLAHLDLGVERCCGHKEYTSRKVDPSFDMGAFRERVRLVMQGLDAGRPPIPAVTADDRLPTLSRGLASRGEPVRWVQRLLGMTGQQVDGVYGPLTEARVREFQRGLGTSMVADGIVGPVTWRELRDLPGWWQVTGQSLVDAPA